MGISSTQGLHHVAQKLMTYNVSEELFLIVVIQFLSIGVICCEKHTLAKVVLKQMKIKRNLRNIYFSKIGGML
jgi:hypothetical protein